MTDSRSSTGSAKHPAEMSSAELAVALDNYARWTVLEPSSQDLLNSAAQRLRSAAQGQSGCGNLATGERENEETDPAYFEPVQGGKGEAGLRKALEEIVAEISPNQGGTQGAIRKHAVAALAAAPQPASNAYTESTRGALIDMIACAYNEGFNEGMREHTTSRGGMPWSSRKQKYSALLDKALAVSSTSGKTGAA